MTQRSAFYPYPLLYVPNPLYTTTSAAPCFPAPFFSPIHQPHTPPPIKASRICTANIPNTSTVASRTLFSHSPIDIKHLIEAPMLNEVVINKLSYLTSQELILLCERLDISDFKFKTALSYLLEKSDPENPEFLTTIIKTIKKTQENSIDIFTLIPKEKLEKHLKTALRTNIPETRPLSLPALLHFYQLFHHNQEIKSSIINLIPRDPSIIETLITALGLDDDLVLQLLNTLTNTTKITIITPFLKDASPAVIDKLFSSIFHDITEEESLTLGNVCTETIFNSRSERSRLLHIITIMEENNILMTDMQSLSQNLFEEEIEFYVIKIFEQGTQKQQASVIKSLSSFDPESKYLSQVLATLVDKALSNDIFLSERIIPAFSENKEALRLLYKFSDNEAFLACCFKFIISKPNFEELLSETLRILPEDKIIGCLHLCPAILLWRLSKTENDSYKEILARQVLENPLALMQEIPKEELHLLCPFLPKDERIIELLDRLDDSRSFYVIKHILQYPSEYEQIHLLVTEKVFNILKILYPEEYKAIHISNRLHDFETQTCDATLLRRTKIMDKNFETFATSLIKFYLGISQPIKQEFGTKVMFRLLEEHEICFPHTIMNDINRDAVNLYIKKTTEKGLDPIRQQRSVTLLQKVSEKIARTSIETSNLIPFPNKEYRFPPLKVFPDSLFSEYVEKMKDFNITNYQQASHTSKTILFQHDEPVPSYYTPIAITETKSILAPRTLIERNSILRGFLKDDSLDLRDLFLPYTTELSLLDEKYLPLIMKHILIYLSQDLHYLCILFTINDAFPEFPTYEEKTAFIMQLGFVAELLEESLLFDNCYSALLVRATQRSLQESIIPLMRHHNLIDDETRITKDDIVKLLAHEMDETIAIPPHLRDITWQGMLQNIEGHRDIVKKIEDVFCRYPLPNFESTSKFIPFYTQMRRSILLPYNAIIKSINEKISSNFNLPSRFRDIFVSCTARVDEEGIILTITNDHKDQEKTLKIKFEEEERFLDIITYQKRPPTTIAKTLGLLSRKASVEFKKEISHNIKDLLTSGYMIKTQGFNAMVVLGCYDGTDENPIITIFILTPQKIQTIRAPFFSLPEILFF